MMGVTHGLAGLACSAAVLGGAQLLHVPLEPAAPLAVIVAATLAAEAPDLDLGVSRISHGSSTLTATRALRPFALVLTLPLVLAGLVVRCLGADHRGATHSFVAAVLSTPLAVALYTGYLHLVHQLVGVVDEHRPAQVTFELQRFTGALLDGWPALWPAVAIAWFVAYLSHLVLDDLTTSKQQLLWPLHRSPVGVFRRPQIPVGGLTELVLVAAPLGAVALVGLLLTIAPDITLPASADFNLDLSAIPSTP